MVLINSGEVGNLKKKKLALILLVTEESDCLNPFAPRYFRFNSPILSSIKILAIANNVYSDKNITITQKG